MRKKDTRCSRRDFARKAVLGAASASVLPLQGFASPWGLPALPASAQDTTQVTGSSSKLSPQSQAEADSRYQTILDQYGARLSEAQKGDLKRLCALAQPQLDRIRAYTIANGELPALFLKPLVDRQKKAATAPVGGKKS